jgi:16S rRNA pseudouridine516 synthase
MMNKPMDVVSSSTDPYHSTYLDFLPEAYQRFDLHVCGRLDVDTTGLLLLTNDGDYLHRVISPKKDVYKTYAVTLNQPLGDVEPLYKGVTIKDGQERPYTTKPAIVYDISNNFCRIKLSEGKFHQVKRMFEAIGYTVVQLKREAIGSLNLDKSMIEGDVRLLSDEEKELVFIHEE